MVRLDGTPALLTPNQATLSAASATYRTGDGAAVVEPSAGVPVVHFTDARGVKFAGQRIVYDAEDTQIATLRRPRVAGAACRKSAESVFDRELDRRRVTARDSATRTSRILWTMSTCTRRWSSQHPQFHLTSRRVGDQPVAHGSRTPAATSPTVRVDQAVATGRAVAIISRPGDPKREIDGDRLTMNLQPDATGKSSPHEVLADGHVRAFDPDAEFDGRASSTRCSHRSRPMTTRPKATTPAWRSKPFTPPTPCTSNCTTAPWPTRTSCG